MLIPQDLSLTFLGTFAALYLQLADRVGLASVRFMRSCFDRATGYGPNMTEAKWLQRTIFLETVAGVPGMVAGMLRHLRSLRAFRTDKGW